MLQNSANIIRGTVTATLTALTADGPRVDTTAAFNGAAVGDKPFITPPSGLSTAVLILPSPVVTTANVITISASNQHTATVTVSSAVFSVSLIKNTGEDNVP